jgi:hypothetical protein
MTQKYATDYIDVAARIVECREKYPDGSLQPADPSSPYHVLEIGGDTFIVVVAAFYRNAEDVKPGIGMAYEPYPGKTNFTRGSELQNAETSAWGRAMVAALAADTRQGVASAQEVRNRTAEREDPKARAVAAVWEQAKRLGLDRPALRDRFAQDYSGRDINEANASDLTAFAERLSRESKNGLPLNKDGTVSVSQLTDEQRADAGLMTSEQVKEHNALVKDATENEQKAERSNVADPDGTWTDVTVAKPGDAA